VAACQGLRSSPPYPDARELARVKVATIVGARPQFVKAVVVSRAFGEHPKAVQEVLIHTGQHYDANMSKVFFEELDIPKPAYNLGIGGGTHGQNTGRMIEQIEQVLLIERPDWVLVYGDTDSTLAGALAAVKLHIPVAHVEAGLRSFNRRMPEEINRVLTDHAADLLFTPTDTATRNLANEGIPEGQVRQVGDVMYDAALFYSARAEARSRSLEQIGLAPKRYVLATVHRAENTDDLARLEGIVSGFAASGADIVWPLHPRTRERLHAYALEIPPNVRTIEPVGYLDMVMLERHAAAIATDSGGVQKEAFFFGVPCVTLRGETEWVELLECGINHLAGTDPKRIALLLRTPRRPSDWPRHLYGDGRAAHSIVATLRASVVPKLSGSEGR
jgi:UDP-GlcNAc3NAcA epimerase